MAATDVTRVDVIRADVIRVLVVDDHPVTRQMRELRYDRWVA